MKRIIQLLAALGGIGVLAIAGVLFYISEGFGLFRDNDSNTIVAPTVAPVVATACGCKIPSITIPPYADSWEDKKENWQYKECLTSEMEGLAEKIHIYLYYNSQLDQYRCQLKYSRPSSACRSSSRYSDNAPHVADISKSTYESGDWQKYSYWFARF